MGAPQGGLLDGGGSGKAPRLRRAVLIVGGRLGPSDREATPSGWERLPSPGRGLLSPGAAGAGTATDSRLPKALGSGPSTDFTAASRRNRERLQEAGACGRSSGTRRRASPG